MPDRRRLSCSFGVASSTRVAGGSARAPRPRGWRASCRGLHSEPVITVRSSSPARPLSVPPLPLPAPLIVMPIVVRRFQGDQVFAVGARRRLRSSPGRPRSLRTFDGPPRSCVQACSAASVQELVSLPRFVDVEGRQPTPRGPRPPPRASIGDRRDEDELRRAVSCPNPPCRGRGPLPRPRGPGVARNSGRGDPGASGRGERSGGCAGRDHPRADGAIARLVDQDEAAGAAVARVGIDDERGARAQVHPADVVERQLGRRVVRSSVCTSTTSRIASTTRGDFVGGVLEQVARARRAAARRSSSRCRPQLRETTTGASSGWQISSPREMSSSSSRRRVKDIGAVASSSSPSKVSIAAMRVRPPAGRTATSSPRRNAPLASCPA